VEVTANSVPVEITGDLGFCPNGRTDLSVAGQFDSVRWSTGETTLTIIVNQPGQYSVTAYINGCSGSASVTVNQLTVPIPFNLGNDTSYCGAFSRVLSTGDQTTVWNTQAVGAQITVTDAGTYIATISNSCGTESDTITITQFNLPAFDLGNDTAICDAEVVLQAPQDFESYLWNTGGTESDTITITQFDLPLIDIGNDTTLCDGQIELIVNGQFRSYDWSTGAQTPSIIVTTANTYSVTVTDGNGCTGSDEIVITIECDNILFIPNAFSPNNDQVNDVFFVRGNPRNMTITSMTVFNRWGEKIFDNSDFLPDDPAQGWDGSYKNKPALKETYAYLVVVKYANGEVVSYKGNVTLLK
jgi:gliding motility-associated-like protein